MNRSDACVKKALGCCLVFIAGKKKILIQWAWFTQKINHDSGLADLGSAQFP